MAQVGSFVPADYAAFPIIHKVFARVTTDDSIEANLSTFSVEMREMAFTLRYNHTVSLPGPVDLQDGRNVDDKSIAVIDELGRGTSTRDGLAIALAMAEALIERRARVWFATHFVDIGMGFPKVIRAFLADDRRKPRYSPISPGFSIFTLPRTRRPPRRT